MCWTCRIFSVSRNCAQILAMCFSKVMLVFEVEWKKRPWNLIAVTLCIQNAINNVQLCLFSVSVPYFHHHCGPLKKKTFTWAIAAYISYVVEKKQAVSKWDGFRKLVLKPIAQFSCPRKSWIEELLLFHPGTSFQSAKVRSSSSFVNFKGWIEMMR